MRLTLTVAQRPGPAPTQSINLPAKVHDIKSKQSTPSVLCAAQ